MILNPERDTLTVWKTSKVKEILTWCVARAARLFFCVQQITSLVCGVDVVVVLVIFLNSLFEDKYAFSLSLDYKSCFNFDHKVYTQSPLKFCFLKEGMDIRMAYQQDSRWWQNTRSVHAIVWFITCVRSTSGSSITSERHFFLYSQLAFKVYARGSVIRWVWASTFNLLTSLSRFYEYLFILLHIINPFNLLKYENIRPHSCIFHENASPL